MKQGCTKDLSGGKVFGLWQSRRASAELSIFPVPGERLSTLLSRPP